MTEKKERTFEQSMEELEQIVEKLEQGEVPLEEAIQMFQTGMKLSKECHEKLEKVEKQMDQIIHEDGEITPLELQEDETE